MQMIVLTGGAGFIGCNTLAALNEEGFDDILVVDNTENTPKWKNLADKSYRQYVHKSKLWDWLSGNPSVNFEAVIHLGACTDTMEQDLDYLTENNLNYSKKIWRFCTDNRIPLIYASSAATYGDGKQGFSDDHRKTSIYEPINPYGASKHLFDRWALEQSDTPPKWCGLKFFNVYGPNENHKGRMASVASVAIPQAQKNGTIRLFKSYREDCADGEQRRDFVYVGDVVDIILFFLDSPAPDGLYNAGSGVARSFNDLALAIFKALKVPANIEYIDMPASIKDSYQYFTEADMGKIRSVGYTKASTPLEHGIEKYVDWLRPSG
jgi:ADP-L-glycero-D-manno-heptose 6-epimerase